MTDSAYDKTLRMFPILEKVELLSTVQRIFLQICLNFTKILHGMINLCVENIKFIFIAF